MAMAIGSGKKMAMTGIKSVPSPKPEKNVSNEARNAVLAIKIISIENLFLCNGN